MKRNHRQGHPATRAAAALVTAGLLSLVAAPVLSGPEKLAARAEPGEPTLTVLSTDLSMDRDPDDWFDAVLFLTLDGIEPAGIVIPQVWPCISVIHRVC